MANEHISYENLSEYDGYLRDDANILKRSTDYVEGNIVNKGQVFLKCTQSGKTKALSLSLSGVSVGDTLADGTAEWEVVSINGIPQGSSGSGLEDWKPNHSYKENDIFVYDGQIYKALVGFTSGNTFGQIDILEDYTLAGETPILWADGVEITTNDIVEYDGNYYKALVDFTCGKEFTKTAFEEYVPKELTDTQISNLVDLFNPSGGSGGGGGLNVVVDTLWSGTAYTVGDTLTLTHDYLDYDRIILTLGDGTTYVAANTILDPSKEYGAYVGVYRQNNGFGRYALVQFGSGVGISSTTATVIGADNLNSNWCLDKIEGIKFVNPNVYSTTEQRIGTWIDGKPLYQITLTGNVTNAIDLSTFGIDNMCGYDGLFKLMSAGSLPINYYLSTTNWAMVLHGMDGSASANALYINYGTATPINATSEYIITIKYTKTTD